MVKFLNRMGLSPNWLAVHEAVLFDNLCPDSEEVMWHGWQSESELLSRCGRTCSLRIPMTTF